MKKIVIFNVGGALSAYGEINNSKFIIDLGKSGDFSPVDDFLLPLAELKNWEKGSDELSNDKYLFEQLFLSHLDNDHISDYEKFIDNFYPHYMTCPNDNSNQKEKFKIKRELIGDLTNLKNKILDDMKKRTPIAEDYPLKSFIDDTELFFIYPTNCENVDELKGDYANNISLVIFASHNGKTILFSGDIMKDGMEYLINNNSNFKNTLEENGVDYLIAPHHGLQTSFSEEFFKTIKGNKTKLNIISEKVRTVDSEEHRKDVDSRYYSSVYSTGDNSLEQNAVKTSLGHIVIDLETADNEIKQFSNIEDVIKEFV